MIKMHLKFDEAALRPSAGRKSSCSAATAATPYQWPHVVRTAVFPFDFSMAITVEDARGASGQRPATSSIPCCRPIGLPARPPVSNRKAGCGKGGLLSPL